LSTAADAETNVGRVPPGPHRLSAREWLDVFKRTTKRFLGDDCLGLAQQVAFSSLLAFIPSVILLVGLLGLIHAYEDLKRFLGTVAPDAVIKAIGFAQESAAGKSGASVVAFVIGLFLALWAASGAMSAVVKAVNRAYDRQETRPFWKVRLYALILVIASGLTTAGLFLLIVFGGPLGNAIAKRAHLGGVWDWLWGIFRWPLAFCVILLFFALVYYLAPNTNQRNWKWVTPGSLIGSILWLVLSGLFALYTKFASSYDKTYGSLAGGIILLLWLYYSALALLFGAELNAELDRQADIHAGGGPRAGLVHRARRNR
jgi:membrane protein